MGKETGLEANKPESWRISNAYFLCETEIPMEERAISRPKKYLSEPRSLRQNLAFKSAMRELTAATSLQ